MRLPLFLFAAFLAVAAQAQQQDVLQQKTDADAQFKEKVYKPGKPQAKTVGGNYRYGTKTPPAEMRENAKQTVIKAPPAPAAPKTAADPGKPLSTSDVVTGLFVIFVGVPIGMTVGAKVLTDEAAKESLGLDKSRPTP